VADEKVQQTSIMERDVFGMTWAGGRVILGQRIPHVLLRKAPWLDQFKRIWQSSGIGFPFDGRGAHVGAARSG
jgi:hypothetical protein